MKLIKSAFLRMVTLAPLFVASTAMAQDGSGEASGLKYLAAALAIGLPAFAGALAQGKASAAALEGIARNPSAQPKIFVPMIIGLALIESLVIYGLLIAFNLAG